MNVRSLLLLFLQAAISEPSQEPMIQIADIFDTIQIAGIFDTISTEWTNELFEFTMTAIQQGTWLNELMPFLNAVSSQTAELTYTVANGGCDATTSMRAYWDVRSSNENQLPPHGIVGAYCSSASISLAQLSGLEEVPQISPFSTSSRLSDTKEFPYFGRVVAPDDERGEVGATVAALRLYGWDRVHVIATDTPYAKDWALAFRRLWEGKHTGSDSPPWTGVVKYSTTIRVGLDGLVDPESVQLALQGVPQENPEERSRVILLAAHSQHAYPILQMAESQGFQPDTIWVGPSGWVGKVLTKEDADVWLPTNPGYLGVVPFANRDRIHSEFLAALQEEQRYQNRVVWKSFPTFGPQLVDGIISLFLGLALVDPSQRRNGGAVLDQIKGLEFDGVGGKVHFTPEGDLKDPQFDIIHLAKNGNLYGVPQWSIVGSTGIQVGTGRAVDNLLLCFPETGCVSELAEVPDDEYPADPEDNPVPISAIVIIVVLMLLFLVLAVKYWRSWISKQSIKAELDAFRDSMDMRTAESHYIPTVLLDNENEEDDIEQALGDAITGTVVTIHPQPKIQWCWKETDHMMSRHDLEDIEGDPAECWIKYDAAGNATMEGSFQAQNGKGECSPLVGYRVVFGTMTQTNVVTGFARPVQRLVMQAPSLSKEGSKTIDLKDGKVGGRLPMDIHQEPQMVLVKGDVVQISKKRPDGWAFGTKVGRIELVFWYSLSDKKKHATNRSFGFLVVAVT
jgi:ABC-type branched-subunit amino acid transport system substrate-binding protein